MCKNERVPRAGVLSLMQPDSVWRSQGERALASPEGEKEPGWHLPVPAVATAPSRFKYSFVKPPKDMSGFDLLSV